MKNFDYLYISYSENQSKNIVLINSLVTFIKSRLSKYLLELSLSKIFIENCIKHTVQIYCYGLNSGRAYSAWVKWLYWKLDEKYL